MIMNKLTDKLLALIFAVLYLLYALLSWILLLRDNRALKAIISFYPQLNSKLFSLQLFFLHHGLNTVITLIFTLVACLLIFLYIKSLTIKISLKESIIAALFFQFIVFFSYPVLSTDIFSYMLSDRVVTKYHQNIWQVKPINFPNDKFYHLADWQNTTSVYGGVNQFFYHFASYISGDNLIKALVTYKILPWIFVLLSLYLTFLLAKRFFKGYEGNVIALVFWNPLFIIEFLGSSHNDILFIFFMLASYLFALKNKYFLSGILLALSFQVKIIPIFLLITFSIYLLKDRKYKQLVYYLSAFLGINVIIFFYMQVSPIAYFIRVLFNNSVYWQSLTYLLSYFHFPYLFLLSLMLVLFFILSLYWEIKRGWSALFTFSFFLLFYLLFFISAYWNWYVLWVLPFVVFSKSEKLTKLVLMFTYTSLLAYPLLWASLRLDYKLFIWPIFTYFFIFLLPLIYIRYFSHRSNLLIFKK